MQSSQPPNSENRSQPLPESESDRQQRSMWTQMGNYAQLAVVFPLATVIGWGIGVGLDHWLHTTWLYLVGLILGIVAGFVELVRVATKS